MEFNSDIAVVGGGLAGTECALQLANMGFKVSLYEMRSGYMTPAHKTDGLAELVCSNSFGSLSNESAPGQLKWEATQLGSFVLAAAMETSVPAGQALGIDREKFSALLTSLVERHENIRIVRDVVHSLDDVPRPTVVASGPLTHEDLANSIKRHFFDVANADKNSTGEFLYFFDAIAPILDADSINLDIAWRADRYDKGTPDYINCPLDRDQYFAFIEEVKKARKIEPKEFEKAAYFESCMPIEAMIERGDRTLAFGPMKPKGLVNPRTGREPYAVVQLRQENREATCYNMVGFQTKMAYGEQTRIFRMIPGLENAEFLKLGSMHRNLFINSPLLLNHDLSSKRDPFLFFAGQITGVEGYFESTCMGLLVARFLSQKMKAVAAGEHIAFGVSSEFSSPPRESAMGSLLDYLREARSNFQPININFGLLPSVEGIRDKKEKKLKQVANAREAFQKWIGTSSSHSQDSILTL